MRKYVIILLSFMLVLAACSGKNAEKQETVDESNEENETVESKQKDEENDESIQVDKNLLNVEVTLPPTFFDLEGQDLDQMIADAKADGVDDVIVNDDGSVTYKMSKGTHSAMMKEMAEGIVDTIEDLKNSEDYTSIRDVKNNKSFSEFTVVVEREAFEGSFDGFAVFGLAFMAMFYQVFDGVDPNKMEVIIHFADESNGEVFNTVVYPEAFGDS